MPTTIRYDLAQVAVAVVLVLVLLLLLAATTTDARAQARRRPSAAQLARDSQAFPEMLGAAQATDARGMVLPMYWDSDESGYMVDVKVGENWVPAVLDSGSSHLAIKSADCRWERCSGGSCSSSACPCGASDCSRHVFTPSAGSAVLLDSNGDGARSRSSTLHYGSQQTDVTHHLESFRLYALRLPCETIAGESGFAHTTDVLKRYPPQSTVEFGPVYMYSVHRITGSSTSNIFGVSDSKRRGGRGGGDSVLDAIYGQDRRGRNRVWSMFASGPSGWFVVGSLRCFGEPSFAKLVHPKALSGFSTSFYVIPVTAVYTSDGQVVDAARAPRYALLDTGTTDSYGTVAFGDALGEAGYTEGESGVRLEFGGGGAALSYSSDQLRDPTDITPTVLHVTHGRTLPTFDTLFRGERVLLLGIHMMRGIYWEFDLHKQRVGMLRMQYGSTA